MTPERRPWRAPERWPALVAIAAALVLVSMVGALVLVGGDDGGDDAGPPPTAPVPDDGGDGDDEDDIDEGADDDADDPEVIPDPVVPRQLTWAPPVLDDPIELRVPAEGGEFQLDNGRDYRIVAPEVLRGPVWVEGGRNIVWIGGEYQLDRDEDERRSLRMGGFADEGGRGGDPEPGRVIHLEGIWAHGNAVGEGFEFAAPSAVAQIQNVRIEDVRFRSANERDARGPFEGEQPFHPDVIQVWGGLDELRVDRLTATSGYQGLMLKDDRQAIDDYDHDAFDAWLRNIDIEAIEFEAVRDGRTYSAEYLVWTVPDRVGLVHVENLYLDPLPGEDLRDVVWPNGADDVWLDVQEDANGRRWGELPSDYLSTASDSEMWRSFDGSESGRFIEGDPPGGDFVPRGVAGIDYRSPGYLES